MFFLSKFLFDSLDKVAGKAFAFSCDSYDIFRVDAESLRRSFHTLSLVLGWSFYTDSAVTMQR